MFKSCSGFRYLFKNKTNLSENGKFFVRSKHKDNHWSVLRKKVFAKDKALNHFDDFYRQVFQKQWYYIREGLLGKQKYVAVINNYGDTEETIANLENTGALNVRTLFRLQKEGVKAKYEENKRVRYLEKVWKLDKEMEQKLNRPDDDKTETVAKPQLSLEASLRDAEIDTSRLIEDNVGLAAPILSQFLPSTKLKGKDDWIPESDYYKYYDKASNVSTKIQRIYDIHFPEHLNVYCYEQSNYADFEHPKRGQTGVYNYYLMDGGSILPVLALDLKPGDNLLDMCAAPGGKSLIALQTLYPGCVICNDVSQSRVGRIFKVFNEYFYDLNERWIKAKRLKVTNLDARNIREENFDRILVDVPCTNDRLSVVENDNNIFNPARIKERLKLPELQCNLLVAALKMVRKGGIVVYSTCSLSPVQNDGVVSMALKRIWEETDLEIVVHDLSSALVQANNVYLLANKSLMKFGHLVLPLTPQNYGPTYFCKLERVR